MSDYTGLTAVIYARYSSDNQREESIEGQIREVTAFAEKNGIRVLRHYIDRAFSAKTDNRPEFQAMIKDSGKKLFDLILVWKLDRFARNRYDSARYKAALKKNGVKVVSATEVISDGAEGIILESVLEGYAEYYSAELSEKVVRGMTDNVLNCKSNGGNRTFGYLIDENKQFQIDPITAPFVLKAFEMYSDGKTMKQIVDSLNEAGIRNVRKKPLTYSGMEHLLKNRRYIGEYRYRDTVVPDGIPAIVSKDLFERVQKRLEKNRRAPARFKAEEEYLLTTKLFCGTCGSYCYGESGTGRNGEVHHYYKCFSAKRHRGCSRKAVKKNWIEEMVIESTMDMIQDDKRIAAITSSVMALQAEENARLPLLEKQLQETEQAIENLLDAIQRGVLTKSTKDRLEQLEAAKEELEKNIALEKLAKPKLTEEQITHWLEQFRTLDMSKKEHRQTLIDTFINRIYLYDDHMVITFNYKEGTKTVSLAEIEKAKSGSDLVCQGAPRTEGWGEASCLRFSLFGESDLRGWAREGYVPGGVSAGTGSGWRGTARRS